jgi:hypothetical protein
MNNEHRFKIYSDQKNRFTDFVDGESDREPESDNYYYGEVPDDLTLQELSNIMFKGLVKFRKEIDINLTVEDLLDMMDGWFEHDSNKENKFDYMIDEDSNFFDHMKNRLTHFIEGESN